MLKQTCNYSNTFITCVRYPLLPPSGPFLPLLCLGPGLHGLPPPAPLPSAFACVQLRGTERGLEVTPCLPTPAGGWFHSLSKAAGLVQLLCLTVNNVTSLPLQMLQVPGILPFLGSLLCPSLYKQSLTQPSSTSPSTGRVSCQEGCDIKHHQW